MRDTTNLSETNLTNYPILLVTESGSFYQLKIKENSKILSFKVSSNEQYNISGIPE